MNKRGGRLGECWDVGKADKVCEGSVWEGEADKKANTTQDADGKSVSEKSESTRTSENLFEKYTHQEFFVDVVKDKRMSFSKLNFLPSKNSLGRRRGPLDRVKGLRNSGQDDSWVQKSKSIRITFSD